jgi:hypothetical protein
MCPLRSALHVDRKASMIRAQHSALNRSKLVGRLGRHFLLIVGCGALALASGCSSERSPSGNTIGASGRSAATGARDSGTAPGEVTASQNATAGASGAVGTLSDSGAKPNNDAAGAGGSGPEPAGGVGGAGSSAEEGGAGSGGGGAQASGGSSGGGAGTSDSAASTGTFPAVSDLAAKGAYTSVTVQNTGPSNGYTLYYPVEAPPEGVLNPLIAWGNGGATTPVDYEYLLPHLATHGFVVIASNNALVAGPDIRSGIDWVMMQNESMSSPLHKRLDTDNVSGVGYSNGGLAILSAADDSRFVTLVIISGASTSESSRTMNLPKVHTPTAYFCTADAASSGNCAADYAVIEVPSFYGVMNGSAHTDVTELLNLGVPEIMKRLTVATTGWLRWQQMMDMTQEATFLGTDCKLCTDAAWTVEPQKNWR